MTEGSREARELLAAELPAGLPEGTFIARESALRAIDKALSRTAPDGGREIERADVVAFLMAEAAVMSAFPAKIVRNRARAIQRGDHLTRGDKAT